MLKKSVRLVTPRLGTTSGAGMRAWKAAVVRAGRKNGSMNGSGWRQVVRMVEGMVPALQVPRTLWLLCREG